MKRQLIILAIASALALGSLGSVDAQGTDDAKGKKGGHGHHGGWAGGNPMEHMTKQLNLTSDQQAKVEPLVDQASPQIIAIHREAMQKTKAIMDRTMDQIRPMLRPEQQQKLDSMKQAHEQGGH